MTATTRADIRLTEDELVVIERDHARIVGSPPGAIEWWMLSGYIPHLLAEIRQLRAENAALRDGGTDGRA